MKVQGINMAAIIGLIPLVDTEKQSYWMLPGYIEGIAAAGGIPIMLPLTEDNHTLSQIVRYCNGFLFTGGQDVSPVLYGEKEISRCGECSPERDSMEWSLLKQVLEVDKPILGICRGIQFLNVALGGTLYQDIPTQRPSVEEHHQKPPYHIPSHEVMVSFESPLYELLHKDKLSVNSYHHQGIKKLAKGLQVMACATDGLIEGVYMPEKRFVWGLQWHPEFSYLSDEDSRKIFEAFVKAAQKRG